MERVAVQHVVVDEFEDYVRLDKQYHHAFYDKDLSVATLDPKTPPCMLKHPRHSLPNPTYPPQPPTHPHPQPPHTSPNGRRSGTACRCRIRHIFIVV